MKALIAFPILGLLLGCPGPPHSDAPLSTKAQLTPTQILIQPGGPIQGLKAHVVQDPSVSTYYPLGNWSNGGTFQWEIVGVPSGVDGGHFLLLASGGIRDAYIANPSQIDFDSNLLQNYAPPTTLPLGTTRLELKIRVTITPPKPDVDGGVAQTEIPLVVDMNAPTSTPSKDRAQGEKADVEENR
jgi:hypothetical protein